MPSNPRLPWKTKRLRRYRRLNRPSLVRLTGCQWCDIPEVGKLWLDNRARIIKRLRKLGLRDLHVDAICLTQRQAIDKSTGKA